MSNRYAIKPVVVEAVQWKRTNSEEVYNFVGDSAIVSKGSNFSKLLVSTLYNNYELSWGDYLVKGLDGKFYVYTKECFEKYYALLEE